MASIVYLSGPYLFLFGSTMFLISKEIWVVDPHFVELGVFVVLVTWLVKRFGPVVSQRLDADLEVCSDLICLNRTGSRKNSLP